MPTPYRLTWDTTQTFKVDAINTHRLLTMVSTLIFLPLNQLYPALPATHIGRVARYTSFMTDRNISAKLRFSDKATS